MANYTVTDLENVTAAIISLATARRPVMVRVGDQVLEYAPADLQSLRELKGEIQQALSTSSERPRFIRATTSKGVF